MTRQIPCSACGGTFLHAPNCPLLESWTGIGARPPEPIPAEVIDQIEASLIEAERVCCLHVEGYVRKRHFYCTECGVSYDVARQIEAFKIWLHRSLEYNNGAVRMVPELIEIEKRAVGGVRLCTPDCPLLESWRESDREKVQQLARENEARRTPTDRAGRGPRAPLGAIENREAVEEIEDEHADRGSRLSLTLRFPLPWRAASTDELHVPGECEFDIVAANGRVVAKVCSHPGERTPQIDPEVRDFMLAAVNALAEPQADEEGGSPEEAEARDPGTYNREAIDRLGTFRVITSSGPERTQEISRAIMQGKPVVFGPHERVSYVTEHTIHEGEQTPGGMRAKAKHDMSWLFTKPRAKDE